MISILQNATAVTSASGTQGLWTNLFALMLASMIALRFSKKGKPFDVNDLAEDLLYGGIGTVISYLIVVFLVAHSNSYVNSPIILLLAIVAFIIVNSEPVRKFFK
jgi:uncharacterized protein YacL